jgi:hypothetical protein
MRKYVGYQQLNDGARHFYQKSDGHPLVKAV